MSGAFIKGLEYLKIMSNNQIDGFGPLDLFLYRIQKKKQFFVYKSNNLIRPPDQKGPY